MDKVKAVSEESEVIESYQTKAVRPPSNWGLFFTVQVLMFSGWFFAQSLYKALLHLDYFQEEQGILEDILFEVPVMIFVGLIHLSEGLIWTVSTIVGFIYYLFL